MTENPYDYQAHVQLIQLYRTSGNFEETRAAREHFRSLLLLKEQEWIEWLEDELSMLSNFDYIKNLFDSALKDRLSVQIWLMYLKYFTENSNLIDAASEFRRGCAFAGWDIKLGQKIWILYAITAGIDLNKTAVISIPFLPSSIDEIENTLFIKLIRPESIRFDSFVSFESTDFSNSFKNYISAIKSSKTLSSPDKLTLCRVTLERALNLSDSFEIWSFYINFLRDEMNVPSIILSVSERLTRAHPLNPLSWTLYFESLERSGKFLEMIEEVWKEKIPKILLQSSLENFVSLQLARLDSLRRSAGPADVLINAFKTAIYEEEQHFGGRKHEPADPQDRLSRYFAHVLASMNEMERCRQVWEQLLKVHSREAGFWLEYLQQEKTVAFPSTADKSKVSSLYKRAVAAVSDYPETIFYEYIQFERQNGSLESLFDAHKRIEKQRALILQRSEQQKDQSKIKGSSGHKRTKQEVREEEKDGINVNTSQQPQQPQQQSQQFDPNATLFVNNFPFEFDEPAIILHFNNLFTRLPSSMTLGSSVLVKSVRMHRKPNGSFKGHATVEFDSESTATAILTTFPKELLEGTGRPIFLTKYTSPLETNNRGSSTGGRSIESSDSKTLFISNLSLEPTDKEIHSLLADTQFLQIRRPPGRNFAYVEYEKEEIAADALSKLNGLEISGQKIRVAFSKPPNPKTTSTTTPPPVPTSTATITSFKPRSVSIKK